MTNLERVQRRAKRLRAMTERARVTLDSNYPMLLTQLAGAQVDVFEQIVRAISRMKQPPPSWL